MEQAKVFIEVTKREVESIGWSRHFRKNRWQLLYPMVITFVALVATTVILPVDMQGWLKAVILLPLAALFLWVYFRCFMVCQKAGKKLWEQILKESEGRR